MAHEIESMTYVGDRPWHGLGLKLNAPPTCQEAMVAAGLDWPVARKPLFVQQEGGEIAPVTGWNAIVRETAANAAPQVLGVVGSTYRPLQNVDAFKWFDPFVQSGQVTLETAGSLKGGKRVWVLGRIAGDPIEVVKDDLVERYVLLSNGHDGTMAIRAGFTAVRVVCANTLAMAHGDAGSKLLRVRHTDNAPASLDVIRETMHLVHAEFEATTEQFRLLARTRVTPADIKQYVRRVFDLKIVPDDVEPDGRADKLLNRVIHHYEKEATAIPSIEGTWWGAYNGITSYISHERGRSHDNRLDSLWFGSSAAINARALQFAMTG